MEKLVTADLQLQTKETEKGLGPSKNSLEKTTKRLMALVATLYPSQNIDTTVLRGWAAFWVKLAQEYGSEMLDRAVSRHLLASKFFPQPAELREHLDALRAEDRSAAAQLRAHNKFVACEKEINGGVIKEPDGAQCSGGLWIYWADTYDSNGNRTGCEKFALRCECLQEWMIANGRDIHDPKDPLKNKAAPQARRAPLTASDSKAKAAGE